MNYVLRLLLNLTLIAAFLFPVGASTGHLEQPFTQIDPPEVASESPAIITPTPAPAAPPEYQVDQKLPTHQETSAREAMEMSLSRLLKGDEKPRIQDVEVKGHWAYGTVKSPERSNPITVTAHRMPDGSWEIILPPEPGILPQEADFASEFIGGSAESKRQESPYQSINPLDSETILENTINISSLRPGYEFLTPGRAYEIAQLRMQKQIKLEDSSNWTDATLSEPISLRNLNGEVVAYLIEVYDSKDPAGYLTVYAWEIPNPVLEFSTEGLSPLNWITESEKTISYPNLQGSRPLYFGPLSYGYELATDDTEEREVLNCRTNEIFTVTTESIISYLTPETLFPSELFRESLQNSASSDTKIIEGIPEWLQFQGDYGCLSGCTPTAATNVMGYWQSQGINNLLPGDTWKDSVNAMRDHMNTHCTPDGGGGTPPEDISPGIVSYSQSQGYQFDSEPILGKDQAGYFDPDFFAKYRQEIDSGRPMVLSFNDVIIDTQPGDPVNHSVTGIGYQMDGVYFVVHDNWPPQGNSVAIQYGYANYSALWMNTINPLSPPNLISPWNGKSTTALRPIFEWSLSPLADNYAIQISMDQDFSSNVLLAVTGDTYFIPDQNLTSGTTYYWRVWAQTSDGQTSGYSEVWQFMTEGESTPPTPTATSPAPPTTTPPPTATPPPSGQAKLWSLANYDGEIVWSGGTGFSNAPSANSYSLELPSGWSAKTWREDNRGGSERCWDGSVHNLQDHGWHLSIQSIEVYDHNVCPVSGDDVILCTTDDASSGCWIFPEPGVYDLTRTDPDLNDEIRSVHTVPEGMSVRLFREGGLRGTCECYDSRRVPLPKDHPWDLRGQVTDVQVFDQEHCPSSESVSVILHNRTGYGGHHWGMGHEVGVINTGSVGGPTEEFNDEAESVSVPNGWSVKLYASDNASGGDTGCLSEDTSDLGSLNNSVSSAEIFHNPDCTYPTPASPSNLTVSSAGEDSLALSWHDNSTHEEGFKIYRWQYTGTEWEYVYLDSVGGNVTSYTEDSLLCETQYYYAVSAYSNGGESDRTYGNGTTGTCPAAGPLEFDGYLAVDDNDNNSRGNGDYIINCDEDIELYVSLQNKGGSTATGINTTISTRDPYISWLYNTSSAYPDISAADSERNIDDFDFEVSANIPDGHLITFEMNITADSGNWTDSFVALAECYNAPEVRLYDTVEYSGREVFSGSAGFSNAPTSDAWSMSIPNDWSVRTWEGDNRTGDSWCWVNSAPNLSGYGWAEMIESIEVFDHMACPEVRLYDGTGYSGESGYVNNPGRYTLEYGFNDRVESIDIPNNWSVRLFKNNDYSGPSLCLTVSDSNLWNNTFDDDTTVANNITTMEVYERSSCPAPKPAPPAELAVDGATQNSLSLAWSDKSDNERGFKVYRWGYDGAEWRFVYLDSVPANATTFEDTGLVSDTEYYYTVSAYNDAGESLKADWIGGKTLGNTGGPSKIYLPLVMSNYTAPFTVYSLQEDGEIGRIQCQEWDMCRNAEYGNMAWSQYARSSVIASYENDSYAVKRTFLRFDTSQLSSDAHIESAILHVYSYIYQSGNTLIHVVDADQGDDISSSDFNNVSFQSGGSANFPSGQWVEIPLNDIGISWITKGDITEIALVHDLDLRNVVPTTGNGITLNMYESGELRPYLEIDYE